MVHIPFILIASLQLAQPPQSKPEAPPKADAKAAAKQAAGQKEAEKPKSETQVKAEKLIEQAAEKIDKMKYVSADLRQIIRVGDEKIVATGVYQKGPDYRTRLELNVDLVDAVGKRLSVCDGKVGYRYDKIMETESVQRFQIDEIMPLLESKDIPPQASQQLFNQFPFVQPKDMLRGYLDTLEFTEITDGSIGARKATVLEGHWNDDALAALTSGQVKDVADLQGTQPQYVRLYLDKETGWPLRIELFRRDREAKYKPIYILEFLKLTYGNAKLEGQDFTFTPPDDVRTVDVTTELVSILRNLPAKKAEESPVAPIPGDVSKPLESLKKKK